MSGLPSNMIIPFVGLDFDGTQAVEPNGKMPVQMYVYGQRLATGTVAKNVKYIASSADEVATKSGRASMLHKMAQQVFAANSSVKVTFLGLDDAPAAVAGSDVITLAGTATASGTLAAYYQGVKYAVGVVAGDTAADLVADIKDLMAADSNCYGTATNASAVLTVTAKNKGPAAGDTDFRFNANKGDQFPPGITLTSITHNAGTGADPSITDAIAAIGADWYNVIVNPYTDDTNLALLEAELDKNDTALEQRTSIAYQAVRMTRSALISYNESSNRNNYHIANLPAYKRMESTWQIAATEAAITAVSIQDDPSKPLQRMKLTGIKELNTNDRWTVTERNQVALSGGCTLSDDNSVRNEACVTMYRKNSAGADSTAYQQQNTVFILSAIRYLFVNRLLSKYPRAKLSTSSDGIGPGQQIMTIKVARAEAVAWFIDMRTAGYVEGGADALDQFVKQLIVKRVGNNRIEWLLPPDLMNQFIVGSGTIQFRA